MTVEAFAPAKINLTLHVTGQRSDGYHLLDSLVVFADFGDHLRVADANELSLTVTGPMAKGVPTDAANLVIEAAGFAGVSGVQVVLDKQLPAEAGIGGGSSDAAAMLRAIAELKNIDVPAGCEALGADVPVCLVAKASRMRGTGERLSSVSALPALFAVLVNPGLSVPTPAVFKALKHKDKAAMPEVIPAFETRQDVADWLALMRNDLEAAAVSLHPGIGEVLATLSGISGVQLARMSGSGATCFALFDDLVHAQSAGVEIRRENPDWWVQAVTLS